MALRLAVCSKGACDVPVTMPSWELARTRSASLWRRVIGTWTLETMCPGRWRLTELGPGLWHATVTTWPDLVGAVQIKARTDKLWHFERSCVVILAKKFWTPVKLAHLALGVVPRGLPSAGQRGCR